MPSYVILGKYTQQGTQDIVALPERVAAAQQTVQDAGGRMIFFYLTMGQYDFVSVVELPDAQAAATILLGLGSQGNVQTTTLTAFTEDETAQIIAGLN